jgi:hypothetical protein
LLNLVFQTIYNPSFVSTYAGVAILKPKPISTMSQLTHESWSRMYDNYHSILANKGIMERVKFYSSKPTDVLDRLYLVAMERVDHTDTEIIFEILRER